MKHMIEELLIGSCFLLTILIFIIFFTKKFPELKNLLLVAYLIRATIVVLTHNDFLILPDSQYDAKTFEYKAREFSRNYGFAVILNFLERDSLLISRIISIFYTLLGENQMLAQAISVILGTSCVYLTYIICKSLWDNDTAKIASWITALFPTLILYSVLTLREIYVVFFLLLGILYFIKFLKTLNLINLLTVILIFYITLLFHGPVFLGLIVFVSYIFLILLKENLFLLKKHKINLKYFFLLILFSIPICLFLAGFIKIPYIPTLNSLIEKKDIFINALNFGIRGEAAYPSWLFISDEIELLIKFIPKLIYFAYAPFVWDIKTPMHIVGSLDGTIYIILTFFVLKNRNKLWSNLFCRILILLLLFYLAVYGLGVSNFGTALRHRSKFVVLLIILAAPQIKKFILSFKKKTYNK